MYIFVCIQNVIAKINFYYAVTNDNEIDIKSMSIRCQFHSHFSGSQQSLKHSSSSGRS